MSYVQVTCHTCQLARCPEASAAASACVVIRAPLERHRWQNDHATKTLTAAHGPSPPPAKDLRRGPASAPDALPPLPVGDPSTSRQCHGRPGISCDSPDPSPLVVTLAGPPMQLQAGAGASLPVVGGCPPGVGVAFACMHGCIVVGNLPLYGWFGSAVDSGNCSRAVLHLSVPLVGGCTFWLGPCVNVSCCSLPGQCRPSGDFSV